MSRSKIRFRRRVACLDAMLSNAIISERRYQIRMTQIFAFVCNCDTHALRRKVISESEQGELSSHARRLLVRQQQRGLCRRVSQRVSQQQLQQQHEPEQQQQFLGLSRVLSSRSSRADIKNRLNSSYSSTVLKGGQIVSTQRELVGIRPNAARGCFKKYSHIEDFSKVERRKARRAV